MSYLFITIPLFILTVLLVCICLREFHREGMARVRRLSDDLWEAAEQLADAAEDLLYTEDDGTHRMKLHVAWQNYVDFVPDAWSEAPTKVLRKGDSA